MELRTLPARTRLPPVLCRAPARRARTPGVQHPALRFTRCLAPILLFPVLISCGGWNDERHDWIIPQQIEGLWIAHFEDDAEFGPMATRLQEYRFTIEELGGLVTGTFEELYYDGRQASYPLDGTYDPVTGFLVLTHEALYYGVRTEIFRFISETTMFAVYDGNHNLPRYKCLLE